VVKDYYKHQKFNVMELANVSASSTADDTSARGGGRDQEK
jgi:hypothetical protein